MAAEPRREVSASEAQKLPPFDAIKLDHAFCVAQSDGTLHEPQYRPSIQIFSLPSFDSSGDRRPSASSSLD